MIDKNVSNVLLKMLLNHVLSCNDLCQWTNAEGFPSASSLNMPYS